MPPVNVPPLNSFPWNTFAVTIAACRSPMNPASEVIEFESSSSTLIRWAPRTFVHISSEAVTFAAVIEPLTINSPPDIR